MENSLQIRNTNNNMTMFIPIHMSARIELQTKAVLTMNLLVLITSS